MSHQHQISINHTDINEIHTSLCASHDKNPLSIVLPTKKIINHLHAHILLHFVNAA